MKLTRSKYSLSIPSAAVLFTVMIGIMYFFIVRRGEGIISVSSWIYFSYVAVLYGLMLSTGKTAMFRRIFFIGFALLFFPSFIMNLVEARGSMGLTEAEFVNAETPFCHIVIPFTLIPAALSRTIIFPARLAGHYTAVYSMLLMWLAASLILGRGWCSWVCFYGGWDEGASRIGKRKIVNIDKPSPVLRNFNYSMLMFLVLISLATATSVYCEWFCPFKLVTEYVQIQGLTSYISTILFIVIFFSLVIVMPILTKKRFQCSVFCPFGAFQSIVDRISLYRIRIDTDACIRCGTCVRVCPTLSITEESYTTKGVPLRSCTKCGECIDACPAGAISYGFGMSTGGKRKKTGEGPGKKRFPADLLSPAALFPFTAFTFGVIVSSRFSTETVSMVLKLVTGRPL